MTAQDLKKSILQLAMQGKLVRQDPNEEPASELLKRIKAEKARLIKEGLIRREKPLLPISEDEIPFDIPESWVWVRIGSAFSAIMGQSPEGSSVAEIEEGIEFHQGKIFFTDEIIAPSPQRTSKPTKIAPSGSILLCVRAPVGKVNITNRTICIGRGLAAILTNGGISKKFTYYMLQTLETVFNQKATGSTFKAISSSIISNQVVPIPPISEQERIVAKIEELLPLIERYDESEKRLLELNKKFPEELRKAILQQAVQGKLTEQDPHDEPASELLKRIKAEKARLIKEGKVKKKKPLSAIADAEIPFEIPKNWEWVRLSTVCRSITDGDHQPPPQTDGGIPFVVISNVINGFVNLEKTRFVSSEYYASLALERIPQKGDILYTVTGSYGVPIILNKDEVFCFQRHIALIKPMIDTSFLYWVLTSPVCKAQADSKSTGIAQQTVGITSLANFLIPVPPIEEQKRIIEKLEELLSACDNLQ